MRRVRWSRLADGFMVVATALVMLIAGGALYYHGQQLESGQVEAYRQRAVMDARYSKDFVAQTLKAVELSLRGLAQSGLRDASPQAQSQRLQEALHYAPHLRSVSLLDGRGTVVASSSPANLGLEIELRDYLPQAGAGEAVLRLGAAHAGRDLAQGRRLAEGAEADLGFVPVALGLGGDGPAPLTLVAALNVDFFLNWFSVHAPDSPSRTDVLRYDGGLLLSTGTEVHTPAMHEANRALARAWQDGREADVLMQDIAGGGLAITAYRGDRVLPFAVVTRIDHAVALAGAREEHRRQLLVAMPLVALAALGVMLAYFLFRRATLRQMEVHAEQVDHLARLLDALPASVLLFGPQGCTKVANQAWRDMAREHSRLAPERLQELHYAELLDFLRLDPEDRGALALHEGIASVQAGRSEQYQGDFTTEGPQGRRWFRIIVRPFLCEGERCAVLLQLDVTAQRQSADQLRLNSRVFSASAEAIVITDAHNRIVSVNPAFTRITGYAAEEVLGRDPGLLASGEHDRGFYRELWRTLLERGMWEGELLNRRKSGESYWQRLTVTTDGEAEGRPRYFVGVFQDITEHKRSQTRLRLLGAALDATANAVVITGADAVIQWANPAFSRLTGYEVQEVLGHRPQELVKSGMQPLVFYESMWRTLLQGGVWRGELVNRRRTGELYQEALTITPLHDERGRLSHFIAIKDDVSERKRQEQELQRLATTDELTGVSNRRAFLEALQQELARYQRHHRAGTLLMIDLDHFKQVNDRHGHAAGDEVLIQVCRRLENRLRRTDRLGRLGGEEFAILLPETDPVMACQLAQELRESVAGLRIGTQGGPVAITVSIGLAPFVPQDDSTAPLLRRADEALYRAKDQGRNRVVVAG